jgi:hypothetical protein
LTLKYANGSYLLQVSLLSEVRGSIHPKDIDRFDDLVLKKEIEAIKVTADKTFTVLLSVIPMD